MKPDKGRRRRKKVYQTPERAKNARNRRRLLLSKADSGRTRRYGMNGEIVE